MTDGVKDGVRNIEGALVGERYRLDQPIGRGRAGIVWLAFDTMLHRTVAAKQLPLAPGRRSANERDAVLTQAQAAMRIVHPSVVTVYDTVSDGDAVWLVMEYVPSRNMADFLSEHGTLTPEQTGYLGAALGAALSATHRAGVVHSAVEPGNVLLADDGGVKLTDVGIQGSATSAAYQAPEVRRGEAPTAQSDAYALGATLFAAVEGSPPFGDDGAGDPVVPTRSGPLGAALEKLLRTEPDLRPTLSDTVAALRAVSKGRQNGFVPPTAPAMPTVPVLPRPPRVAPAAAAPAPPESAPTPSARHLILLGAAAVVVVAALVAVIVLF